MSRSVVLAGTVRCDGCRLPPRWCVCGALPRVRVPLRVEVLLHAREQGRPTSTGQLIGRAVEGARLHVPPRGAVPDRQAVADPGRALWILHPRGTLLEPGPGNAADLARLQVLLLDGSWTEASDLLKQVEPWGRCVRLPLAGESRYWLRSQAGPDRHSTVEALRALLDRLGLAEAARQLQGHFELQVYAALRSRGRKREAEAYLATSPIRELVPEFLARLQERRPDVSSLPKRAAVSGIPPGPAVR
ncbi:MAG: DTW domain-containing protein [Verrucomicrobiota bacterium]